MKIKVIARTTDESVYVVRAGGPKHGRVYLELEERIPESAFPKTRAGYDRIPLSDNPAFNAELTRGETESGCNSLTWINEQIARLEIEILKKSENGEVN